MSGFGVRFDRPEPGVEKNAPKKAPFFFFWELYVRKFFSLVKLNLLFSAPALLLIALGVWIYWGTGLLPLAALPLILLSPLCAGMALVTRNYAREEHAFLWRDFWKAVRGNWKMSLLNGLFTYVVFTGAGLLFSGLIPALWENPVSLFGAVGLAVLVLCFFMMELYVPVQIVTFALPLHLIYRNALIFAVHALWRNLLLTAVQAAVWGLLALAVLFSPAARWLLFLALLFWLFLLFSFCFFTVSFGIYPVLYRYMIGPAEREKRGEDTAKAE